MDLDPDACYRAVSTRDARFDGRLFTGVLTTGIYCRPICPARTPKRGNVTFFPTAAAAQEAGFRPCLRCRPETSPDLGAWRGSSNTVSRALALIEAGAMDEADVEALAERLGVGERQLRRLFRRHLGASPVSVAQTRRVLLAKQLIHETQLSMADVALASGFGSVRRFNETFQQLFDRPPGALRRSGAAETSMAAGVTLRLAYKPPYDWDHLIAFLAGRAIPGVEVATARRYVRTLAIGGRRGVVAVEPAVDGTALLASVRFSDMTVLPAVIARVRRVFDLTADPLAIGEHLSADAELAPLVAARPGLRTPGAWDGFELAVRAILGQQITVGAATRLAGRIVEAYGEPLAVDVGEPGLTHLFPEPARLVGADIAAIGMPKARGHALERLAAAACADPGLFSPTGDLESQVARLKALPGIGEWTAQYIALRELREPDAFPHGDVALVRALERLSGERPDFSELSARAERWRPWRAYAALHLWAADAASAPPKTAKERKHAKQAA